MKLVVGLGNPGPRYADSRHNVGFMLVDELQRAGAGEPRFDRDFQGLIGEAAACGQRVLLLKPATYMNLSGQSVSPVVRFYKLAWSDVLVAYDDLDLPPGRLRVRANGSAGGHKGLTSVLQHAGTQDIARLRVGIGRGAAGTVDFVLGAFSPQEREQMALAIKDAADAVECWLTSGTEAAMNRFNARKED